MTESKTPKAKRPAVSAEGKRRAAVLLDVLAGVRTPQQAAEVLGLSLPGFYQLEERATRQFELGCESRPRGRQPDAQTELHVLKKENERLVKELGRHQTLLRLTQRTVGVPPPAAAKVGGPKKRKRRPTVRAMRRADRLRAEADASTNGDASSGTE